VEIDLSQVSRIDFAVVGLLLETLIEISQAGCKILFKEGNELVNTLLQIVGVSQFAGSRPHPPILRIRIHGTISRHHHSLGPARRIRRHGRRWPGHPGQHRHQGRRAQGAPAVSGAHPGRVRRRHGGCLHPVRTLRGQAGKHQGHLVRSAVELAKDWRTDRMLRRLEAMLAVADRPAP
jgi:hypothetical protein